MGLPLKFKLKNINSKNGFELTLKTTCTIDAIHINLNRIGMLYSKEDSSLVIVIIPQNDTSSNPGIIRKIIEDFYQSNDDYQGSFMHIDEGRTVYSKKGPLPEFIFHSQRYVLTAEQITTLIKDFTASVIKHLNLSQNIIDTYRSKVVDLCDLIKTNSAINFNQDKFLYKSEFESDSDSDLSESDSEVGSSKLEMSLVFFETKKNLPLNVNGKRLRDGDIKSEEFPEKKILKK